MDKYERAWRAVRGSWFSLEYNLANIKSEREYREERYRAWVELFGQEYADAQRREGHEREARRIAERRARAARDAALRPKLASLVPVNDWVGAAWMDPEGNLYPVRHCNHYDRAEALAPHHFPAEVAAIREREGWCDCGEFLSQRKGWLRIGANGLVGDHQWVRVREMPQAQLDAISSMLERGKPDDYSNTGRFMEGLRISVRFALGEVNENGQTPEEAKREEEWYDHLRRQWAISDAERAKARRSEAAKRGWQTRRRRAAVAV